MRKVKLTVLSMALAAGSIFAAAPARAVPPHCDPAGELPDPCPVAYQFCQTKLGQLVCRD